MRSRALLALLPSLALALGAAGCASGEASPPPAKAPSAAKPPPPAPPVAPGHLRRDEVDHVLTQFGPPWILRRVRMQETFGKDGKFLGWQLTGLPEDWAGIDLKPGDVVKRVNGKPLETPDEAWDAWKSVAKAKEIRVTLERGGKPMEIVIPIAGDLQPAVAQDLERGVPARAPAPRAAPSSPRGVVQIGGGPAPDDPDPEAF